MIGTVRLRYKVAGVFGLGLFQFGPFLLKLAKPRKCIAHIILVYSVSDAVINIIRPKKQKEKENK